MVLAVLIIFHLTVQKVRKLKIILKETEIRPQRCSLKIVPRKRCPLKKNNFKVCLLLFPLETRIFNQYLTKRDKGLESMYVSFSASHLTDFMCPASCLAGGSYVTLGSSVPRLLYSKATKLVFEHINLQ